MTASNNMCSLVKVERKTLTVAGESVFKFIEFIKKQNEKGTIELTGYLSVVVEVRTRCIIVAQ